MKWTRIEGDHNANTDVMEIRGIGCLVRTEYMGHLALQFVPGVRLEGEELVAIPPPQETFSYGVRTNRHASPSVPMQDDSDASVSFSNSHADLDDSESYSESVSPSPSPEMDFWDRQN